MLNDSNILHSYQQHIRVLIFPHLSVYTACHYHGGLKWLSFSFDEHLGLACPDNPLLLHSFMPGTKHHVTTLSVAI